MIIVNEYRIIRKNDYYKIIPTTQTQCPNCNSPVKVRDSRKRYLIDADGNKSVFRLRRLYCPICCELHIELPDIMAANKHYGRDAIASILTGKCDSYVTDDSTVRRWRKSM